MVHKTTWDLSVLEGNFDKTRKIWLKATDTFVSKWKPREDYLKDPSVLREALDEYERWSSEYGTCVNESFYYWLKTRQDQNDASLKAKSNKIEDICKDVGNKMTFFELNISKVPKSEQSKFLTHKDLQKYSYFLKRLFETAQYTLSEAEERIMTLKSQSSHSSWVKMVSGFLSKEEREVTDESGEKSNKTSSDLLTLMCSKDKKVRDEAAVAFNDILEKHSDVAAAEINAILEDKKVNDKIRGYSRPDESRHVGDGVDTKVIDTLVKAVSERYKVSKEFYKFKARLLGKDKLAYHERNVDYGSTDKRYSYEDSVKLVKKVFSRLDKGFSEILTDFADRGQIDVYPKKGKSGGAFCVHVLKTQPTYILLNHTDKLRDVETLAHEMGHAINNELTREKQNSLYFHASTSTAEVASIFMEDFVFEELLVEADDELRLSLMVNKLGGDISAVQRQIACYTFEQDLHNKYREIGHLSKKMIGELFLKHMSAYLGDFVEQSPGSENWWVYWDHIRMFFYTYSYAKGVLVSKALQRLVKEDPKNIEKVKQFLAAGTSKSPVDIFKDCGLDITKKDFWDAGLKEIEDLLIETKALAKKLGKI